MWVLKALDAAGCEYARSISNDTWIVYFQGHEVGTLTAKAMRCEGTVLLDEARAILSLVEDMKWLTKELS